MQLEKKLREQVDFLKREKHDRMKKLKKLKEIDQHLCDVLCVTPYYIPSGKVPTLQEMQEMQHHIDGLQAKKVLCKCVFKYKQKYQPDFITHYHRKLCIFVNSMLHSY